MANNLTKVFLLNVPLENDYKHTLYFADRYEQNEYFVNQIKHRADNCSYQRKDNIIRFPKHYDEIEGCNYVMYCNSAYSDKWIYAFIKSKTYIQDDRTDIEIETDVIQTYMFDYTIKPSFVEREHCEDDTIGLHTIPENLETGEFVTDWLYKIIEPAKTRIVIASTTSITTGDSITDNTKANVDMVVYNGVPSSMKFYAYENDPSVPNELSMAKDFINVLDSTGAGDAVQSVFLAPSFLTETQYSSGYNQDKPYHHQYRAVIASQTVNTVDYEFSTQKNPYIPKNNKLHCYPYNYLMLSNNAGGSAIYQYEHFKSSIKFRMYGVLTPGCSIRIVPKDYKNVPVNHEEGLNLGKYPILNWSSDIYTNWLTQNGVNIAINGVSGVGQIVGGVAMAVGTAGAGALPAAGMIASGVSAIANQLGQIYQMSLIPPQSKGNLNCGDVITMSNQNTFTLRGMHIKEEYTRIIDEYFTMFGYKTNRVKVPSANHRENFWYTKTIDVSIDGAISNNDMQKIKNCYNNGITFWKNPANIGDYSVSNEII